MWARPLCAPTKCPHTHIHPLLPLSLLILVTFPCQHGWNQIQCENHGYQTTCWRTLGFLVTWCEVLLSRGWLHTLSWWYWCPQWATQRKRRMNGIPSTHTSLVPWQSMYPLLLTRNWTRTCQLQMPWECWRARLTMRASSQNWMPCLNIKFSHNMPTIDTLAEIRTLLLAYMRRVMLPLMKNGQLSWCWTCLWILTMSLCTYSYSHISRMSYMPPCRRVWRHDTIAFTGYEHKWKSTEQANFMKKQRESLKGKKTCSNPNCKAPRQHVTQDCWYEGSSSTHKAPE